MWGVAKIFTSGHSKGEFDEPLEPPLATGMYIYLFHPRYFHNDIFRYMTQLKLN